jgi:hypothetical protein
MLFAQVDWPFVGCVVLVGGCFVFGLVWSVYMATFRTQDFIELSKLDEERRRRIAERQDKHLDAGLRFVGSVFKKK